MSRPSNTILPAVGSQSRVISRPVVRLAAARLAHQAERLALRDGEVDAVDRLHRADLALQQALADREVLRTRPVTVSRSAASPLCVRRPGSRGLGAGLTSVLARRLQSTAGSRRARSAAAPSRDRWQAHQVAAAVVDQLGPLALSQSAGAVLERGSAGGTRSPAAR